MTHNMTAMADEAGIYDCLWRPEENGYQTAGQIIPVLEAGIKAMEADSVRFKAFNPKNGWGDYTVFLQWLKKVLAACEKNPDYEIEANH